MTGEFITDSRARGCFIVIISYDNTADVFRALQREDSAVAHIEEIINVPPSTYTVYAYDLEENALPNPFPANTTSSDAITITTPCKKHVLVNTVVTHLIIIHTLCPMQYMIFATETSSKKCEKCDVILGDVVLCSTLIIAYPTLCIYS